MCWTTESSVMYLRKKLCYLKMFSRNTAATLQPLFSSTSKRLAATSSTSLWRDGCKKWQMWLRENRWWTSGDNVPWRWLPKFHLPVETTSLFPTLYSGRSLQPSANRQRLTASFQPIYWLGRLEWRAEMRFRCRASKKSVTGRIGGDIFPCALKFSFCHDSIQFNSRGTRKVHCDTRESQIPVV